MRGGRPLRFLALALSGWVMIRVVLLLPEIRTQTTADVIPRLIRALVPEVAAAVLGQWPVRGPAIKVGDIAPPPKFAKRPIAAGSARSDHPSLYARNQTVPATHADVVRQIDRIALAHAPPASVTGTGRLHGTAWLLVRGGAGGTVSGGQLGASQGGMRIIYTLDRRRRFALTARVAAPLKGAGREAALGVEWQPTRLPIRLVAEQRFVLDGGRGGPTLGVIAGYGPSDVAPGVRVEAYGQAGAIARAGIEGFVDASARVTHRLGGNGNTRLDIGIGIWGSAQRGVERLDVGPTLVASVPVAGKSIRLTLDWRERIVGAARPGSGPALSVGSDF